MRGRTWALCMAIIVSQPVHGVPSEGESTRPVEVSPKVSMVRLLGDIGDGAGIGDVTLGANGDLYVAGQLGESTLELTNVVQGTYAGGKSDAFVARLDPRTLSPKWLTFLGGMGADIAHGIAVDREGSAWVIGQTSSADFPLKRPVQSELRGQTDVFVAKIGPEGEELFFSTLLGTEGEDSGAAVHVDAEGHAYVTGRVGGTELPVRNALQARIAGKKPMLQDAFVAKIAANGSKLVYATYLGGALLDEGYDIVVDQTGCAIVAGVTWSKDFPTARPLQADPGSGDGLGMDAFVSKLSPDGSKLLWSTYLGGQQNEFVRALDVDSSGTLILTGRTASDNFPTRNAFQTTLQGPPGPFGDGFVAAVSLDPPALLYSSYLGGAGQDFPLGIAAGAGGRAYVVGRTGSSDLCGRASSGAGSASGTNEMTGFVVELHGVESPTAPEAPDPEPSTSESP